MRRRTGPRGVAPLLAAALLLPGPLAFADRLHLENGGVIEVGSWWFVGEQLHYDNGAGAVGLPRSMVVRIERVDGAPTLEEDAPGAAAPKAAALRGATTSPVQMTPDQAARLQQARSALESGDYDTAATLYDALLDDVDPALAALRLGYALSHIALGRDAQALGVVLDGLARDPDDPHLLELLGDLRDREERVEDALGLWRRAFELSPADRLRTKVVKAERELHAGGEYDLLRSSHFNLRFDGEVEGDVVDDLLDELETLYGELARELDHAPPQPITVLLYPEREFRDVTQTAEWVAGLYDGKIRVPLGGLSRVDPAVRALLAHELTHAVLHSKTRGQCPRWLHEGLAQRSEGRSLGRAARQALRHQLQQSDPAAWESSGFSYPVALSLTSWLERQRGTAALLDLLERLGGGQALDLALQEVYGVDYAGLCRNWAASVLREIEP